MDKQQGQKQSKSIGDGGHTARLPDADRGSDPAIEREMDEGNLPKNKLVEQLRKLPSRVAAEEGDLPDLKIDPKQLKKSPAEGKEKAATTTTAKEKASPKQGDLISKLDLSTKSGQLLKPDMGNPTQQIQPQVPRTPKVEATPILTGPISSQAEDKDLFKRKQSRIIGDDQFQARSRNNDSDLASKTRDFLKGDFPKFGEGLFSRSVEPRTKVDREPPSETFSNPFKSIANFVSNLGGSTPRTERSERNAERSNEVFEARRPTQAPSIAERIEKVIIQDNQREEPVRVVPQSKEPVVSQVLQQTAHREHVRELQDRFSSALEKRFAATSEQHKEIIKSVIQRSPEVSKLAEIVKHQEVSQQREILPQIVKSIPEAVRMATDKYLPLRQEGHSISPADLKLLVPDTIERLKTLHGIKPPPSAPRPPPSAPQVNASESRVVVPRPREPVAHQERPADPKIFDPRITPKAPEIGRPTSEATQKPREELKAERAAPVLPGQPIIATKPETPKTGATPSGEPLASSELREREEKRKRTRPDDGPEFVPHKPIAHSPQQAPQHNVAPSSRIAGSGSTSGEKRVSGELEEPSTIESYDPESPTQPMIAPNVPYGVIDEREKYLKVQKVHVITGTVRDIDTGRGVPGVYVSGGVLGNALTNVLGEFSFINVPDGQTYTLGLSKSGYRIAPSILTATAYGPNHHAFKGEDQTPRRGKKARKPRSFFSRR